MNGGVLDPVKVREARRKEIHEVTVKHTVYTRVPLATCWAETGKAPIDLRWIDANKGDDARPEYRSWLVGRELKVRNTTLTAADLLASTTPFEML